MMPDRLLFKTTSNFPGDKQQLNENNMILEKSWSCRADFSLEITAKDGEGLKHISGGLSAGTIVTIPFIAGESDDMRVHMATSLRHQGFVPMPHIAARRLASQAELKRFLEALRRGASVDRLLVIAGDCQSPEGPYEDSLAILKTGILADYGIRHVAISGYPEGNPKIPEGRLLELMSDKIAVLMAQGIKAEIATQFSFSAESILLWLSKIRAAGIHAPVRVGIPGPASARTLLRYATMCGVGASKAVLLRYGFSLTQLMSSAGPDKLVNHLSAAYRPDEHGVVYAHYYPFGGLKNLTSWLALRTSKE